VRSRISAAETLAPGARDPGGSAKWPATAPAGQDGRRRRCAADAGEDGNRSLDQAWRVGQSAEGSGRQGLVLPAELETEAQLHFETYWGFGRGYRRIDFSSVFFESDAQNLVSRWR